MHNLCVLAYVPSDIVGQTFDSLLTLFQQHPTRLAPGN